jgi:hypothetical protein
MSLQIDLASPVIRMTIGRRSRIGCAAKAWAAACGAYA